LPFAFLSKFLTKRKTLNRWFKVDVHMFLPAATIKVDLKSRDAMRPSLRSPVCLKMHKSNVDPRSCTKSHATIRRPPHDSTVKRHADHIVGLKMLRFCPFRIGMNPPTLVEGQSTRQSLCHHASVQIVGQSGLNDENWPCFKILVQ
jgi:hypothetical protein